MVTGDDDENGIKVRNVDEQIDDNIFEDRLKKVGQQTTN